MQAGNGNSPNWEHYKSPCGFICCPTSKHRPGCSLVSVHLHSLLLPAHPGAADKQIPTWLTAVCLDLYVSAVTAKGVETVTLFSQRIIKHLN